MENNKLSFKEFNSAEFNKFLKTDLCSYVQQICSHFRNLDRATTLESQRVKAIFNPDIYEKVAKEMKALPVCLVNKKTVLKQDVKKGDIITYDMVELDESSFLFQLRKLQDTIFA